MNSAPKVLVCAPTNRVKDYALSDYLNFVWNMTYPDMDLYLCDNSPDKGYWRHLNDMGIKTGYVNPKNKHNREYMAESMDKCRVRAMEGGYAFMLVLETDVIPPCRDIIERLMLAKVRVISGIYHIMTGKDSHLCISEIMPTTHVNHIDTVLLKNGMDTGFVDGTVKKVFQSGLGCTLIARSVFEKIKFRVDKQDFHADTWFYVDLANKGIGAYADTGVLCEHNNTDFWKRRAHEQYLHTYPRIKDLPSWLKRDTHLT
jgi:hypothetical protein